MKKAVSFWIILLCLVLAASYLISCRDDVVVPYPPSLVGQYEGIYSYHAEKGTADTSVEQLIRWRFSSDEFRMNMESDLEESERVFCDVYGEYELGNGVELILLDSSVTVAICTESWGPDGFFSLDQTTDTVKLTQIITDTLGVTRTKQLKLVMTSAVD